MRFIDQVESWEVWLTLACLLFFGVYFGHKIDFENMLKKDSPVPVHMGGGIQPTVGLGGVHTVSIPGYVYDSLEHDKTFKRYLTGNHKYILFFTYPGCPYSRAFKRAFKYLFSQRGFEQYYRKRIITVGRFTSVSCPGHQGLHCATAWVYEHCFGNLCIFNPLRRQIVVDSTQNARQIEPLLQTYQEW